MATDLILSSGFLAFARHAGVLQAVEDLEIEIDGVCGTSSGALAGAMWAAGWPAAELYSELCRAPPIEYVTPHLRLWRGVFTLDDVIFRLRQVLPPTFAELPRPFAVGVTDPGGNHHLIWSGRLPEAVAASCAMPWVFAPIEIDGVPFSDGGAADRTGIGPWRAVRPHTSLIVHLVERTRGADGAPDLSPYTVVRSAPSGASLFALGDTDTQRDETRRLAVDLLDPLAVGR